MTKDSFNPLIKKAKESSVAELQPFLINAIDLHNQIKLSHWNLKAHDFIAIHRLLDEVAGTVLEAIDLTAERVRQLGVSVSATTAEVAKGSNLKKFPEGVLDRKKAVTAVCESLSMTVKRLHESIEKVDEAGDAITADLLTQVSRSLEVQLWFLESHLP